MDHAIDSRGLSVASPEIAAWLSLVAYVRHTFTDYDELLAGHKNIQHTVRYTELAPTQFKDFWRKATPRIRGFYTCQPRPPSPAAGYAMMVNSGPGPTVTALLLWKSGKCRIICRIQ